MAPRYTIFMSKVIIASTNPVKRNATQQGFLKIFPKRHFVFEGLNIPSGVSDQPMTDEETFQGALNRANNAKKTCPEASFWVGIEGGVQPTQEGLMVFAWVVILSASNMGTSRTSTFLLPPKVTSLVNQGIELGVANDMVFHKNDSKRAGGAVGSLTNGQLGRTEYYVQPVVLALVPFLHPDLYAEGL